MFVLAQFDVMTPLEDMLASVLTFIPQLLGFLLILAIGYFVAKIIAKIIAKVLDKVGFDRAVERGGVKKAMEKSEYDPSDILGKLAFYTIMLFVIQLAFGVFPDNPISDIIAGVIAFLPRVFVAIVILVVASAIAAAAKELIEASLGGLSYGKGLAAGVSVAIVAIGVFAALNQLQIAPAIVNGLFYALLAIVAGSAIIAIGGGGVMPMRGKWEQALNKAEAEVPKARAEAEGSKERIDQRAKDRKRQAEGQSGAPSASQTPTSTPPSADTRPRTAPQGSAVRDR